MQRSRRIAGDYYPCAPTRISHILDFVKSPARHSSHKFYNSMLIADKSVTEHCPTQTHGSLPRLFQNNVLNFVDTSQDNFGMYNEFKTQHDRSTANLGEAALVVCYIQMLISCGFSEENVGVITPYKILECQ